MKFPHGQRENTEEIHDLQECETGVLDDENWPASASIWSPQSDQACEWAAHVQDSDASFPMQVATGTQDQRHKAAVKIQTFHRKRLAQIQIHPNEEKRHGMRGPQLSMSRHGMIIGMMPSSIGDHSQKRLDQMLNESWVESIVDGICDETVDDMVYRSQVSAAEESNVDRAAETEDAAIVDLVRGVVDSLYAELFPLECAVETTQALDDDRASIFSETPPASPDSSELSVTPPASSDSSEESAEEQVDSDQDEEAAVAEDGSVGSCASNDDDKCSNMRPFLLSDVDLSEHPDAEWIGQMLGEMVDGVEQIMVATGMYLSGGTTRMRWDNKLGSTSTSIWHATNTAPLVSARSELVVDDDGQLLGEGRGRINSIG